jgi:hypothetical protein
LYLRHVGKSTTSKRKQYLDYGVGSLSTSRDARLYVRDKSASQITPDPPQIHQFVSFQTPPSPVISDVETLRGDDNESNYGGSDKELKMAQNILDELELLIQSLCWHSLQLHPYSKFF